MKTIYVTANITRKQYRSALKTVKMFEQQENARLYREELKRMKRLTQQTKQ